MEIHNYQNNSQLESNDPTYFAEIKIDDGKWTRDQTQILIDTWKQHKDVLLNSASSLSEHFRIWKIIASEVNKLSPPKSLQQCKKKFRNIRYICKTAMNNNKQPGAKKHYPMFYSEFVKILSESQKLLFGDKMKYDMCADELSEYHNMGEQIGAGDGNQDVLDYEQNESGLSKYYCQKGPSYNSPGSSPQNSPTCSNDGDTPTVDVNGSSVVSLVSLPSEIKSEITLVPNGAEIGKSGEQLAHQQTNDDENSSNAPARKHRHNDVSILGPGYPSLKRPRIDTIPSSSAHAQTVIHHKSIPSHKMGNDYYPTMASLPSENNHILSSSSTSAFTKTAGKYDGKDRFARIAPAKKMSNGTLKGNRGLNPSPNGIKKNNSHPPNANLMEMFQERFLDLQERQMELFNDMLNRHEQFLLRLLQQQREAAEEAQQRDRNFMFKLVEIFLKQKN